MLLGIFHWPPQIYSPSVLCSRRVTFCLNGLPYPLVSGWIQPMGSIGRRQKRGRKVNSGCQFL